MTTTRAKILSTAQRLCQRCGYNGFSYADIATELEITKATVHHHFPTKEDLGVALIHDYASAFQAQLQTLDATCGEDSRSKLGGLVEAMAKLLRSEQRICLCGMLASDSETLGNTMQAALRNFYQMVEAWLSEVIHAGQTRGQFRHNTPAPLAAQSFLSALQGMTLSARTFNDAERLVKMGQWLIDTLSVTATSDSSFSITQ